MDMSTREICKICYHANAIGFRVPDHIWDKIVPDEFRDGVICVACFTRLGDEKCIMWDEEIEFFPVSLATHLGLACPSDRGPAY